VLVAAHALEAALLLLVPVLGGRFLWRRWKLPGSLFGLGLLTFVFAELGRLLAASLFQISLASAPALVGSDAGPFFGAVVAGLVAALVEEPLRWWGLRRYVEKLDVRSGIVAGLGQGAGRAGLIGVLTLIMGVVAIAAKDMTFDDMRALGLEERVAVKTGLRVFAWWEGSPSTPLISGIQGLAETIFHVGLGALAAKGILARRRAMLALTITLHALFAFGLAALAEGVLTSAWAEPALHLSATLVSVVVLVSIGRGCRHPG